MDAKTARQITDQKQRDIMFAPVLDAIMKAASEGQSQLDYNFRSSSLNPDILIAELARRGFTWTFCVGNLRITW